MEIQTNKINSRDHSIDLPDDLSSLLSSIIRCSSLATSRIDFLKQVSLLILDFIGCDEIVTQLFDYERIFTLEAIRHKRPPHNIEENYHIRKILAINNVDSKEFLDSVSLGALLTKTNIKLTGYNFSSNGSFYTKESKGLCEIIINKNNEKISRFFRIESPYQSISMIPIKAKGEIIGLLQLKMQSSGFFKDENIELLETITEAVGSAALDKNRLSALRERIKELECFYGISKILEQPYLSLNDILDKIVKLMPPAWLFPEITTARILVDGESFTADQFKETPHRLSAEIYVEGLKRGSIEVFYLEEMPAMYEGPFLLEERRLLDAIARQLSQIIIRKTDEEENVRLQEQIRHADRLATVGQLAAGIAHELNEPLANILGFSQIILDETELTGQVRKDVKKIEKASLYARDVVKKLLLFSRQMPQNKTKININQIVEDSFFFFESRCINEGLVVVKKLNPDVPQIHADPSQLQQVIINLVVNAIQAMSPGDTLTLITYYNEESIVLVIEDTGAGMSDEVKKQIFAPFYTTKEVDQGTGLGLSVVHGIVTSHGGEITVESKVGEGSRFEIILPINYNAKKMEKN